MTKHLGKSTKIVNVYIDGFNLYHAIVALNDAKLKWINFKELGKSFLKPSEVLGRVVFFTAILTWEKEKQARHKNYIAAQKACGVEVVESNFRRVNKHCRVMDRYCSRHEEKQTDVAIAVSVLMDAVSERMSRAILITADSDQIPLVKALAKNFPAVTVTLAAPPGRGHEARELGSLVSDRRPITADRLRGCALPRDVFDAKGKKVATRPAIYRW